MPEKVQILAPVDFHGQALTVVSRDEQPYVAMKPVVEGMGLSWPAQYRKLSEEGERWGVAMIAIPSQGGEQTALCLPLRKLMGWLVTLQPNKMNPEVASRVLIYQNECDDALWAYWSKGAAINPRAQPLSPTQMFLLQAQAMAAQEERQTALESQQDVLKTEQKVLVTRVDTIENKQQRACQTLLNLLPPGVGEDIEGETRDSLLIEKLHRIVNAHADETYASYKSVWKDLYKRFDFRKHVRIYRRLEHRVKGETILSIIEKEGGLPQLYALAWEAYAPEETKVKHRKNLLKSKSN